MNRPCRYLRRISLDKTYGFRCTSSRFTNADERRRLRDGWLTRLSAPALYQVSVRSLAALRRRFLPTVDCSSAVAGLWYLVDRSHSWYTAFLKTFVLVQGTFTPQVIRHARRTKSLNRRWLVFRFFKLVFFVYGFRFFNVYSVVSPTRLTQTLDPQKWTSNDKGIH